MTFVRRNVWALGGDWNDTVLWYARAVAAMKAKPIADATAWRFWGAIHGLDASLWQQLGWLKPSDPLPSAKVQQTFWMQCQHGSWYFLPWHRGYLMGLEAILRDFIVKNKGPKDWALPYWNYMKKGQNALPPAFASPDWPDGKGNNPLFTAERYGPNNDGKVYVPQNQVNVNALGDVRFSGPGGGGSRGFGGVKTTFSHGGSQHGDLETQPHDYVHGLVGGGDPKTGLPGLMSDPDTAALDPIFYLHHCNIDRLWEVWLGMAKTSGIAQSHMNPTDTAWLNGPKLVPAVAGHPTGFAMPGVNGAETVFKPSDVANLSKLNYKYDDVSNPLAAPSRVHLRMQAFGLAPTEGITMAQKSPELLGANAEPIKLTGTEPVQTEVKLDKAVREKVSSSFGLVADDREPDRVFLNLENVRGLNDAKRFEVYVNVPEGAAPADHPENKAGAVALFGVKKATRGDDEHAGNGLDVNLEITDLVDRLHLQNALDADHLKVRIVPLTPIADADQISIGRVSVFRQGA